MKRLGLHRVDGRSYWFAAYFNAFDRALMVRYAGAARADRFGETFGGAIPFADAKIVRVFDQDEAAARQFSETFDVPAARTIEEFAEGLDGVIVPFPSGGPARDYEATAMLARRGIPLFLDRIILERSRQLRNLVAELAPGNVPLHVTCFTRYLADLVLPGDTAPPHCVIGSTGGDPAGYGADLLDLVDELMSGQAVSVVNTGNEAADVLRIRYEDGRHAILQLFRTHKSPMSVTAFGDDWCRSMTVDGSLFHRGAFRQFKEFLRSLDTRQPPVSYHRVFANAAILRSAERRVFGRETSLAEGIL
jgi:hypothetical protein